jgi:transposase
MSQELEQKVAREAKAMTRREVIIKALAKKITWQQAADICGMTTRNMRRLHAKYLEYGMGGLVDGRGGRPRRPRVALETVQEVIRLKEHEYADFSVKHFHEQITAKHGLAISYKWTLTVLQDAGLVERAPARGKHRRKRERRPMRGMMMHLDGSTHPWIAGLPSRDLIWLIDDADGRVLFGRFVPEEGTMSTFEALEHVLRTHGRFCELYHDRGSHFCRTSKAGHGPDEEQKGQVSRALKALGIRQIFARSPEARGRSERSYRTVQGRLPQELRRAGITDYDAANRYLEEVFISDFNRRFSVRPAQAESAFTPLVGIDLRLLLSVQHERSVRKDNTVTLNNLILQIPESKDRVSFARCPVLVHELTDDTLAISYQGKMLARYNRDGDLITERKPRSRKAQS